MAQELRLLTEADAEESFALSQFAFQYTMTDEEKEARKKRIDWDQHWGYFVEGNLAARMSILPLETWIQGRLFRMGGIASVATWPEYRRQGLVGRLLGNALSVMREAGQTVSYLAPFSFPFYRKYGWEHTIDYVRAEIPVAQLAMRDQGEGRGKIVRHRQEDWALLNRMYEAYAARYSGMLRREESWWKWRVFERKPGQVAVYYSGDGTPTGYMLYEVKQKKMTIHEFVPVDEEARIGLWKFVMNHDSMVDQVINVLPPEDPLAFLLVNPRIKQELVSYFMARIVDVKRFLEQYPFAAGEREEVWHAAISDPYAPWNEGVWRVAVQADGTCRADKLADACGTEESAVDFRCDIATLTAALIGYRRPGFLQQVGRLQGDSAPAVRLDARIPRRGTYLADFF